MVRVIASQILQSLCSMLKNGTEYSDAGQDYYEQQHRQRVMKTSRSELGALAASSLNRSRTSFNQPPPGAQLLESLPKDGAYRPVRGSTGSPRVG